MDGVITWVKQIFILSIISNIIIHLMPSDKYTQYAKFICGIIIAFACISPLLSLINGNLTFADAYESIVNQQGVDDLKAQLKYTEKDQAGALIEEYKKEVIKKIEEKAIENKLYPSDTSIVLDTDPESENYGSIQQINMTVSTTKTQAEDIKIGKIEIGQVDIGASEDKKNKQSGTPKENSLVEQLRSELSSFYNLSLSNININSNGV